MLILMKIISGKLTRAHVRDANPPVTAKAENTDFTIYPSFIFNSSLVSSSVKWGPKIKSRFARESKGENVGNVLLHSNFSNNASHYYYHHH